MTRCELTLDDGTKFCFDVAEWEAQHNPQPTFVDAAPLGDVMLQKSIEHPSKILLKISGMIQQISPPTSVIDEVKEAAEAESSHYAPAPIEGDANYRVTRHHYVWLRDTILELKKKLAQAHTDMTQSLAPAHKLLDEMEESAKLHRENLVNYVAKKDEEVKREHASELATMMLEHPEAATEILKNTPKPDPWKEPGTVRSGDLEVKVEDPVKLMESVTSGKLPSDLVKVSVNLTKLKAFVNKTKKRYIPGVVFREIWRSAFFKVDE